MRTRGLRAEAIDRITIRTFKVAAEIIGSEPEKWMPQTRETADHSMPYLVAAALVDGEITERQFTTERIRRDDIRALMAQTEVVEQADFTAAYPTSIPTMLDVWDKTGRLLSARVDFPPGHSRNPLTDAQLDEKFMRLAEPVLGSQTGRALEALRMFESSPSVRGVVPLLVRGRP